MIRFYRTRVDGDVWRYAMEIDGEVVARDLTIDQVVEAINRRDEETLGAYHAPRAREESPTGCAGAPFRQGDQRGGDQNDPL